MRSHAVLYEVEDDRLGPINDEDKTDEANEDVLQKEANGFYDMTMGSFL